MNQIFIKILNAPTAEYYHLFDLYNDQTFLAYKPSTQSFVFVIENDEVPKTEAYTIKIKDYVGNWAHFGFSIYHSIPEIDIFPHMFNFMINRKVLSPISFNPNNDPVKLNKFSFSTIPICYII